MRLFLCVLLSMILPAELFAQSSRQTVNQFVDWFSTSTSMKFTDRFSLFTEGQFRFVEGTEAMMHQFRIAGDFAITPSFSISPVGYTYIWNYQYGKQPATYVNNEHRIYQQFTYKHKFGSMKVQHRLRTEERFIQDHTTDANGEIIDRGYINKQFRIRYRLSAQVPLTGQKDRASMSIDAGTYYLFVYDELFMSWGERITYHEIDQNRVFIGLGYQFTEDFTIQSGAFYMLFIKSNGTLQENNIGVGTWLTYNFDFRK